MKHMETQLVRLDAPYNIIFGKGRKFGLHIATLLVVKELKVPTPPDEPSFPDQTVAISYPVVTEVSSLGGHAWMDTQLDDCFIVGPQNCKTVPLQVLKQLMEYCDRQSIPGFQEYIPAHFVMAMQALGCEVVLPADEHGQPKVDYTVELEFEETHGGNTCMVYSKHKSDFFFYDHFENYSTNDVVLYSADDSIAEMQSLRNDYLLAFMRQGLRSITFETDNKKYQSYVKKLNKKEALCQLNVDL